MTRCDQVCVEVDLLGAGDEILLDAVPRLLTHNPSASARGLQPLPLTSSITITSTRVLDPRRSAGGPLARLWDFGLWTRLVGDVWALAGPPLDPRWVVVLTHPIGGHASRLTRLHKAIS